MRNINHILRRWLFSSLQGTTYLGMAMIGVLWLGAWYLGAVEGQKSEQGAVQNTSNLARAFAAHTARSIKEIDETLMILRTAYEGDPQSFDLMKWANSPYFLHDLALQISIIGPDGFLKDTNIGEIRSPLDLRDREHFKFHLNSQDDRLFIGKPVIGRASGKWSVQLARRIRSADGSFGGVIVGSLDPYYFSRFYQSIDVGRDGAIVLTGLDGIIRASGGLKGDFVGRSPTNSELFRRARQAPSGSFMGVGGIDGIRRLVSYRVVEGFPLVVSVALAEHEIFADYWRNRAYYYVAAAAVTLLVLIVMAVSNTNRMKLAETSRELELTLDNMSQGIMMIDRERNVAVMNRQTVRLLGLPERMLGTRPKFDDILSHQWSSGEFGRDGAALDPKIRDFIKAGGTSSEIDSYERTRPDGTVLEIRSVGLPDGGLVRTYTDITERKRTEAQIAHMARHDALTGLPNRLFFGERMEQAIGRMGRHGEGFAVFCLDLDKFKSVNDSLGHPVGDELLQAIAHRLRSCIRDTDIVARLGGDEFAILQVPGERDGAVALAERLLQIVGAPYDLAGHQVIVGTSVGIAIAPGDGAEVDKLMRNADLALYRAKSKGEKGYRFFESEMNTYVQTRHRLETDLRNGLARGEFRLHYQPLIDLRTDRISGFEALLRWNHPDLGMVPPLNFIPLAEETGLIVPLGEWALRQACAEAMTWPRNVKIAVNLSPTQFKAGNLVEVVTNALAATGLRPEQLELEITESVLLEENAGNLATLHQLRDLGVGFALDDFGTGYSSLRYLHTFPFNKIKIDKSFVGQLSHRPDCVAIVHSVAALGRSLGMTTTAEGVETQEQLQELRAAGCTEAQGYLFSRPRPAEEFAQAFAKGGSFARAAA